MCVVKKGQKNLANSLLLCWAVFEKKKSEKIRRTGYKNLSLFQTYHPVSPVCF